MLEMLFSFKGRVGRMVYWMSQLGFWVGAAVIVGVLGEEESIPVIGAWLLVAIWPLIAIQVRRWHDRDKSGAWMLINAIPVVGEIWALVENGFLKGTKGANRFGNTPM